MARTTTQERVKRLEKHLQQENPILSQVVSGFQKLDRIARGLGLMEADDSYATQVSWWPVVSILGTFSAGKSTFINQYTGHKLQRTGNQAVDDKFTVLCYGNTDSNQALPGLALDSDPRFPFYQISHDIDSVAEGEGRRVDSYLQLKTCKSENLLGKILIDSPGFDADHQRTSTLLIIDHIIDLSDLVLVFFDGRHPEPGAMADTLAHLVKNTINRHDATKFLYILNQIDNTAREDNPEEVVAAWQRALAQQGLTAGRFYRIYSREAEVTGVDDSVKQRLERIRDEDLKDIEARMTQVEVERAYRVVGVLEKTARHIQDVMVPRLSDLRRQWRKLTATFNTVVFGTLLALFAWWSISSGYWVDGAFTPLATMDPAMQMVSLIMGALVAGLIYYKLRGIAGSIVARRFEKTAGDNRDDNALRKAFKHNRMAWWKSVASPTPRGWGFRKKRMLEKLLADADGFVQTLNDQYASPSGKGSTVAAAAADVAEPGVPEKDMAETELAESDLAEKGDSVDESTGADVQPASEPEKSPSSTQS